MLKYLLLVFLIAEIFSVGSADDFLGKQNRREFGGLDTRKAAVKKPTPPKSKKINANTCEKFVTPSNSGTVCTNAEICVVTCRDGFTTDGGNVTTTYACKNRQWYNTANLKTTVEPCEPNCSPVCKNGGKCVAPNVCQCAINYYGPRCEFEQIPCSPYSRTPLYSIKKCSAQNCTISCVGDKVFPDGSSSVELYCEKGKWISSRADWTDIPNCGAVCEPDCMNGGKCVDTNTCFCPQDYRGEICQHSITVCDSSKLNFNGNYNCTGNDTVFSCVLSCPQGMNPSEKFASKYSCLYSTGVFTPTKVPQCLFGNAVYNASFVETFESSSISKIVPTSSSCAIWGSYHVRMLNGNIRSFKSNCMFMLVRDEQESLFLIMTDLKNNSISNILLYIGDEKYKLYKNVENKPELYNERYNEKFSVPNQMPDLKVEMANGKSVLVYLPATNIYLLWNLEDTLKVDIPSSFWNKTAGLCGRASDSRSTFRNRESSISDSVVTSLIDKCDQPVDESAKCKSELLTKAKNICGKLTSDVNFNACQTKIAVQDYVEACEWSYCNCVHKNPLNCICNLFARFIDHCSEVTFGLSTEFKVQGLDWRKQYNCSFECPSGQTYTSCVPLSQATCTSNEVTPIALKKYCEEGCVCPSGTVLQSDQCIKKENCSCIFGGNLFAPGSVVTKDCNKCSCLAGKWSCTTAVCKSECLVYGNTHYRTFDGKKYDFFGTCSYYLVVADDVTVELESSCRSSSKEVFIPTMSLPRSRCLKSIVIKIGNKPKIHLKDTQRITVGDKEVESLPVLIKDSAYIKRLSTFLIRVTTYNGLEILWDGRNVLRIFANSSLLDNTKGLCGTFNGNQKDDLLTPFGDIELEIQPFVNKWKTSENCVTDKSYVSTDTCEVNVQNKPIAEKFCGNLTDSLFTECHSVVNPKEYYEDCLNSVCSCTEEFAFDCFCPIFVTYAQECSQQGVVIDWRSKVRECGVHCPKEQKYKTCGSSCHRSCSDLAHEETCTDSCTEGCYCPDGYVFDEKEECIPISECPCIYKNQKYLPYYREVRNESDSFYACKCKNALWDCKEVSVDVYEKNKRNTTCPSSNMEHVECEPPEPVTCNNMHNPPQFTPATCVAGCVCKDGYVFESTTKECIKPSECPCHHGGRSYADGETIKQECNNCTCSKGKWECTTNECASVCSSWGDSHFCTFDGQYYDFQGTCDYIFAKAHLSDSDSFMVSIEIVPCGTGGTSCIKAVTMNVGSEDELESITLDKEKKTIPNKLFKRIKVFPKDLYIIVAIPDLSVHLQWDKGTRVSLQVHSKWKNMMKGLCGNNNGNALDDFQTPSGGLVEVSSSIFADSWKLQQHCPIPPTVEDPCTLHPHRKFWAIEKCSFLKNNPLFKQCHSEVPVEEYYKRCVFDSCACDQGGDCECLCTSFAAYAQECSLRGVNFKWRHQNICPIQCTHGTEYDSCISPCPDNSCEHVTSSDSFTGVCQQLPCVEGCVKKRCSPGLVYRNISTLECIPPNDCICMKINGTIYKESELIGPESDSCRTCYCSKGKKVCKGKPCSEKPGLIPCVAGWSDWIVVQNKSFRGVLDAKNIVFINTNETLNCLPTQMTNLTCRSKSSTGIGYKDENCSFSKEISCEGDCMEYQFRVQCTCEGRTTVPGEEKPPEQPSGCVDHWSEWIDISTPTLHENNGEYELIKDLENRGITACPLGHINDIECKYQNATATKRTNKWALRLKKPRFSSVVMNLLDWKETADEGVICDKDVGLICNNDRQKSGVCKDYQIRFYCSCGISTERTPVDCGSSKWVGCKMKCSQMCHYYKQEFIDARQCEIASDCIPGCDVSTCPPGTFWKDNHTCVSETSCSCRSANGTEVLANKIFQEDECRVCQCLNNQYICSNTGCTTPSPEVSTEISTYETFTMPSVSVSPLPLCNPSSLIPVDTNATYNAGSCENVEDDVEFIETNIDGKSWRSFNMSFCEFLEVDLKSSVPVYGVVVSGNPVKNEYVKSYKVFYSIDKVQYYSLDSDGKQETFRGPHDHDVPETQIFDSPVEARYIRFRPVTWNNWIFMTVKVLGCKVSVGPEVTTPKEIEKVCQDPMGLESGKMNPSQITVSSVLYDEFEPYDASLSSSSAWVPLTTSENEWIQFDFLGERIITGISTKGSSSTPSHKESWVETYKVKYSQDGVNWNSLLNQGGTDQIFPANVDGVNLVTNYIKPPIRVRYVRIFPVKWSNLPKLRIELLGCFEPYPIIQTSTTTSPEVSECNVCNKVPLTTNCTCTDDLYWDGENCVVKTMCPCVEKSITYSVGSEYMTENCAHCICGLGGLPVCESKTASNCPACNENSRKLVNSECSCVCVPCSNGTVLCPTSNVCINETAWCDGYRDCPDDEIHCKPLVTTVTPVPPLIFTETPSPPTETLCPPASCPTGYRTEYSKTKPANDRSILKNIKATVPASVTSFQVAINGSSSTSKQKAANITEYIERIRTASDAIKDTVCLDWSCVPIGTECMKPICPQGTRLITRWTGKKCPVYECLVMPPTEKECNINGRMFNTFDGSSFLYDVCDHVLAQDSLYGTWKVRKTYKCPFVGPCTSSLVINHHTDVIEMFTNFSVSYNGYKYTLTQLETIGSQTKLFLVHQVSKSFVIFSSTDLLFNVVWGSTGSIKIIVDASLHGMVDGLCGHFDFKLNNDKMKPDGTVVVSTQEFGDSWSNSIEKCDYKSCPKDIQTKAVKQCSIFKEEPFSLCDSTLNLDEYVAKCVESLCTCSMAAKDFDSECRCEYLQHFASTCSSLQTGVDISSWRIKHDCPVNCTSPLVYNDCYDKVCETSCETLLDENRCPRVPERCFPGCYCPEGYIREGDSCITPSKCRNCKCSGNGLSQFSTFDKINIPFDNSCSSYLMVEVNNTKLGGSELKIILTNGPCVGTDSIVNCPHSLTIAVAGYTVILLAQSEADINKVNVKVNETEIQNFPYETDLFKVTESTGKYASLSIPEFEVDVVFMSHNRGFSVNIPSYIYSEEKMGGLCGTCNGKQNDDIITSQGEHTKQLEEFLNSWKTNYTADPIVEVCSNITTPEKNETAVCIPPENDPCLLLLDVEIFGQCHPVVSPEKYLQQCYKTVCERGSHCLIFEEYAIQCQDEDVCIPWRNTNLCPYTCPAGLEYNPCSSICDKTCENYKEFDDSIPLCQEKISDNCVCPEEQVILNGTCVNPKKCNPCDKNGHYPDDKWKQDNCTTCTCMADGTTQCKSKDCPEILCPLGTVAKEDFNNDDTCCPRYVCVSEDKKQNCSDPVQPVCGKDQETKIDFTADNCTQYICTCIPSDKCPPVDLELDSELLPGMVKLEKKEGCCPSVEVVCDNSTCPQPVDCPRLYQQTVSQDSCCPQYKCELPPNKCIYEYHWIANYSGGERERTATEVSIELKEVNETWFDGPCRQCYCTSDSPKGVCSPLTCLQPTDSENYVIKPVYNFGECCPQYKQVACKVNNVTYEIGERWKVSDDPCKSMSCVQNEDTSLLYIKETNQYCDTICDVGWQYVKPENSTECCGSCKRDGCVDNSGTVHMSNNTWFSEDNCVQYECSDFNIVERSETCSDITFCPQKLRYHDGCCWKCNISSVSFLSCALTPLNETDVISKLDETHGLCTSAPNLPGFSKCTGNCGSEAYYDQSLSRYTNDCQCCIGVEFKKQEVELTCKDGFILHQEVEMPSDCGCQGCGH